MSHNTFEKSFELQANQAVSIGECKGLWLRASQGIVWITISGVGQDIFLSAGQSRQINHPGAVVMEALGGPAGVSLERNGVDGKVEPRVRARNSDGHPRTGVSAISAVALG